MQQTFTFTRRIVHPNDILDAAANIQVKANHYGTNLIEDWTTSDCYLAWAKDALSQHNDFGRDAAVCYAKRAACRQIDAFMVCNHLWHLDSKLNYPEKIKVLSDIGLYVPSVVHELVINPRNQLEHSYHVPTEAEAVRAVQLCELFLKATFEEAKRDATILIGCISFSHEMCDAIGKEYDRITFVISSGDSPILLTDVADVSQHEVIILLPKDAEAMTCPLQEFDRSAAARLAIMLREHYKLQKSGAYSSHRFKREYLRKLREDMGLQKQN
jgi:hypothetical protein